MTTTQLLTFLVAPAGALLIGLFLLYMTRHDREHLDRHGRKTGQKARRAHS